MGTAESKKGRRITVDLTPAATAEVDRLRSVTGLTTADLFRHALTLLRIYVQAKEKNQQVHLVGPKPDDLPTQLELPVPLSPGTNA